MEMKNKKKAMSFRVYISLISWGRRGDHQLIINLNNRNLFDLLGPFVPYEIPRPKKVVIQHGKLCEESLMQIGSTNNKNKTLSNKVPLSVQQGLSVTSFSLFGFRTLHC